MPKETISLIVSAVFLFLIIAFGMHSANETSQLKKEKVKGYKSNRIQML